MIGWWKCGLRMRCIYVLTRTCIVDVYVHMECDIQLSINIYFERYIVSSNMYKCGRYVEDKCPICVFVMQSCVIEFVVDFVV